MAASSSLYTKLPGRGLRRTNFAVSATRCRLWLAADHLLAVDYTIASEEYRRFYFRDIEAFIIHRTARRQVWNWVLLALILISAGPFLLAWRSEGSGGFLVTAICFAAFWLALMLVNTLRGATCQTHIRTAVQLEQLPTLGRLPVARKVLARVQPLIVAAQGAATAAELSAVPWMSAAGASGPGGGGGGEKALRADKGILHGVLFALLMAEGVLTAISFLMLHEPISVFSMLAMLSGCILCVAALMRQGGTDLPDAVRIITKVTLGYYGLKCLVGFIYMIMFSVNHPGTPMVTGLEMIGEPGFAETALASAGLGTLVGLIGCLALFGGARRAVAPPQA